MNVSKFIELANTGKNIFITGMAGTGKSFTINKWMKQLKDTDNAKKLDSIYISASTGIAAIQVGGQTLHRIFGMGLGVGKIDVLVSNMKKRQELRDTWASMKTLIIDEISMMDIGFFIRVSKVVSILRSEVLKNPSLEHIPFGGIQIILVGDFLQLKAIKDYVETLFVDGKEVTKTYKYLFQHPIWDQLNLNIIYLQEPMRYITTSETDKNTSDKVDKDDAYVKRGIEFFNILSDIRIGKLTPRVKDMIKYCSREPQPYKGIFPTIIYSTNQEVDDFNAKQLASLKGKPEFYDAIFSSSGSKEYLSKEDMVKSSLTTDPIVLKVGAQVMLLVNKPDFKLANGSRGVVVGFTPRGSNNISYPIVEFMNGQKIEITPHTWSQTVKVPKDGTIIKHRYSLKNLPLKLAYSITCHKSQGTSLDNAYVSLSKCFSPGQIYVALSRCRDMDNLYISDWNPKVFNRCLPDKECIDFYNQIGSTISDTDINKDSTNNK